MRNYALDGRYHLDNNDVERGQRPSVMGRKNYLFSHDDKVAEDNAIFYSLLESCDVVQLTPLDWLTDVLGRLRDNMDEDEIMQLLPYQYKKFRENLGIFLSITGRPKLNGYQVSANHKGLQILKLSDGRTLKTFVR